jgi:hypothetical protein
LLPAACIALWAGSAPFASPAQTRAPPGREDSRPGPEDVLPLVLGGIGLFGGGTPLIDTLTGKEWVSPRDLDRNGPVFPTRQALGRYQVQGYALPGWPVVVDVETQPGTQTWLVVGYRGKKQEFRARIPGEGRRVHVVTLPVTKSAKLTTARYSLHSFSEERGKQIYRPHSVYAVGAGPRAVGSTTLQIISLSPAVARRPADVRYSLVAKRLFDRSSIEVLRVPPARKGAMKLIKEQRRFPLQPGTHGGSWGAMRVEPRPASGQYHFQARAWLVGGRNDERDWTGAIAPNFVRIP